MPIGSAITRPYLVACDFDQTLSFNDSGIVLSELIGASSFRQKIAGLSSIHLVQQGAELAKRTVVSDNALSVLVPILEDVVGWDASRIRRLFESYGLVLQEWHKARTDWVTFREDVAAGAERVP